jgi:hypothetical protein
VLGCRRSRSKGAEHTAIEHALGDERSINPANAGIKETLTPFSSNTFVTLKSVGSKDAVLCAITLLPTTVAPTTNRNKDCMLLRDTAMQGEDAQSNGV